jgi:hypothetical protein
VATTKKVQTQLHLPPQLRNAIKRVAAAEGVSMSRYVEEVMTTHLMHHNPDRLDRLEKMAKLAGKVI